MEQLKASPAIPDPGPMSGKNTLPEEALVGMLGLLQYLPSGITKY